MGRFINRDDSIRVARVPCNYAWHYILYCTRYILSSGWEIRRFCVVEDILNNMCVKKRRCELSGEDG